MIYNDCTVKIGFNVNGSASSYFILDSSVFGILGTSRISAVEYTDVTEYVKTIDVKRGRSRQLDSFNAGTASISFDNRTRIFDPLNESSVFYPEIKPRGFVQILCKEVFIFNGFINDWNIEYDLIGNDFAVVQCSDAFGILANQLISSVTPSVQKTGERISTILNRTEISFVGPREISTGQSTVGAYAIAAGTNALNYFRQLERSEVGNLFVDSSGTLVFRQRGEFVDKQILMFSDDGNGIPYQSLQNQFGDELLYNYVRATSPAGVEQIKYDQTSIDLYQISQLSIDDLLNSSTSEVGGIASMYLGRFKDPQVRLTSFSVQLRGISETDKESILSLELTDLVNIKKSFTTGTPVSFEQLSFISGISHNVKADSHIVTFNIENATGFILLVLGSTITGQLDFGSLDLG